jgi:hypothetical protein
MSQQTMAGQLRLPASAPAASTPSAPNEAKQQQEHHRAYEGVQDERKDTGAEVDTYPWQQPIADKSTD